jgi:hypothetical protein
LKEFYVLNDLNYLNAKNKKLIYLKFYDNYVILIASMVENLTKLEQCPYLVHMESRKVRKLSNLGIYFKLNFIHFMDNFDERTLKDINAKYVNSSVKYKDVDNLRKTRLIKFYSHLFASQVSPASIGPSSQS